MWHVSRAFARDFLFTASAMTINRYCASVCSRLRCCGSDSRWQRGRDCGRRQREHVVCALRGQQDLSEPWLVDNYPGSYMSMGLTAERVARALRHHARGHGRVLLPEPPEGARGDSGGQVR